MESKAVFFRGSLDESKLCQIVSFGGNFMAPKLAEILLMVQKSGKLTSWG